MRHRTSTGSRLAGDDARGTPGRRSSRSPCVPGRRRPGRRAGTPPRRRRPAPAGCCVVTTVVRPARCAAQPRGDPRLGVGVDRRGRLDQHQDLGVGGERAGQHQPLPLAAGERAAALGDHGVEAVGRAPRGCPRPTRCASARRRRRRCRVTSSRSPSRPENSVAPVSETTIAAADLGARAARSAGTPPRRTSSSTLGAQQAEPVGERRGLVGLLADDRGEQAGPRRAARCGRRTARSRRAATARGRSGSARSGVEREHAADPARRRPGRGSACWRTRWRCAAGSSGTPSSRRTRPARRRVICPATAYRAPSQTTTHHEDAGQEDLQRVEHRLQPGDLDAGPAGRSATRGGSGRGRPARRRCRAAPAARRRCRWRCWTASPISSRWWALRALQRREQRADQQHQQRHADQHDQAERAPRCCSRITDDQQERHDRAGEPGASRP